MIINLWYHLVLLCLIVVNVYNAITNYGLNVLISINIIQTNLSFTDKLIKHLWLLTTILAITLVNGALYYFEINIVHFIFDFELDWTLLYGICLILIMWLVQIMIFNHLLVKIRDYFAPALKLNPFRW